MENICKLTGIELTEGVECPLKKMCLNCASLVEKKDGTFACKNEKVMEKGKEKILASVPEGFEIDSITLKPMNLKNPTKKCGCYSADMESIMAEINKIFE